MSERQRAELSRTSFKALRGVTRGMWGLRALAAGRKPPAWQCLSGEMLAKPGALAVVMTNAPRWNPHAVIASAGPLLARQSITVDAAAADRSADSWTVVVSSFPRLRAVGSVGAQERPLQEGHATFAVPPGRYTLALRYYDPKPNAVLPEVRVDGEVVIPSTLLPPNVNAFYARLAEQTNARWRWLALHVFHMLRHPEEYPPERVARALLPVGNPETQFYYGLAPAGTGVVVTLAQDVRDEYGAYLTLYNNGSFPVSWMQVTEASFTAPAQPEETLYLLRLQPRHRVPAFDRSRVRVTTSTASSPTPR